MNLLRRAWRKFKREWVKNRNKFDFWKNEKRLIKNDIKLSAKKQQINSLKPAIKLYWYQKPEEGLLNFGDEFSAVLISKLTGYNVEYTPSESCELFAVGSLLERVTHDLTPKNIKVWGSGFIREDGSNETYETDFWSVRGKLTKNRLNVPKDIVLGDPGILASACFPQIPRKQTGKIGFVAHYVDANHPIITRLKKDKRFMLIDPLTPPEVVAEQIASCKFIISSSLHGLIFADSYGVPNAHIVLSNKVLGGAYKFLDYCSGVNKEYVTISAEDVFNINKINELINSWKPIENLTEIQQKIMKAFLSNVDSLTH